MKIERSQVTKLYLTELKNLDPITVFLEDFDPSPLISTPERISGRGRITVSCYGESWTSFWPAMGDRTIAQFFIDCSADYIIGNFAPSMHSTRFCGDALVVLARKRVLDRRRNRKSWEWMGCEELSRSEAAELWGDIDDLQHIASENECWQHDKLLSEIFGDEWHHEACNAKAPNPKYHYLERVIHAVQEALKQEAA